ncbi:SDR family oxidoreductase [Arcobacter cryaerophilus gv. pseudocryaerophilus]|jgi:3-oxoacyl-[acyl-carrier protein] reductase|uniref:SDR family oxidoreductase n=3 Tax=unclassified Arcobacter TaxID=2593671 RepID=A0AA96RDN4_9BACT|nr:SDR family oxidoreductase [Arcobacter sp. AZ-2023]WPD05290.1 SDR family oxidoreductase [Arcobacter sp. DSM 115956]WPD07384.1 SDR family oxidoreductase [Arcobacter sp. DSM 115955]WNL31650.1 SDR family oxidoreductase [Arcobacter sp. AZ-2023]WNP37800.1 SDR family oxidoreductase [Arcobacter sp. AZ-2023]
MKKVLVTGATGSIGEEIVKEYAKNGFFVYIHYNSNHQKAQNLLEEIDNKGELISFDIKDKESIKNSLENLDVDVLINNAGIIKDNLFFFMSDDEWEDVINTNLNGNFYITKIISKNMMMNKKGSIVNIASISGVSGNAGQANYSASKGGIIALTKTLCLELGRYNIRVNALAPAIIESEMTKDIPNLKEMKKAIPLGRFGTANEVASCAYFIGVDATYISGEVLNISGGMIR